MTRIRITDTSISGVIPLSLNGEPFTVEVDDKGEAEVPEKFLGVLRDSNHNFVLVGKAPAEGAEGARGDSGEPAPEVKAEAPAKAPAKAAKPKAKPRARKAPAKPAAPAASAPVPASGMTTTRSVGNRPSFNPSGR